MDHQVEGVDRISCLPSPIHHHILSFIDFPQDLIITGALSREWKMIWASFPRFEYDVDEIKRILRRREDANPGSVPRHMMADAGWSLVKTVTYRLALFSEQRDIDARSFSLAICPRPEHVPFVDNWIQVLVDKNVEELDLSINPRHLPGRYTLPNTILSATRLTSLTLDGCDLPVIFMDHDVPINSLATLALIQVRLSDQALRQLTVVFPSLEKLFLSGCSGYTRFVLPLLEKLDTVELWLEQAELIQLDAPELQHLAYDGRAENISFDLSSCNLKLKTLCITNDFVLQTSAIRQLVSTCPVLEEFSLDVGSLGEQFIVTSFSLKELTLGGCLNVKDIRINAPGLELFSYAGEPSEITFSFTSQTVKCEARMPIGWDDGNRAHWLIRLNNFLLTNVRFKTLHMQFGAVEVDVEGLDQKKFNPFELDDLVVDFFHIPANYRKILAAVFWCCNPLSLTFELQQALLLFDERNDLFRYVCEQLQRDEDQDWEKEVQIRCTYYSDHTQRFASIEEFIHSLPDLKLVRSVCFKTQRVERNRKKRRTESCSSSE